MSARFRAGNTIFREIALHADRPILYCFPYAGGDTPVFHGWIALLQDVAEVRPVQLPGRGRLMAAPRREDIAGMVDWFLSTAEQPAGRPAVLFGHSMGSLIAYEVARAWRAAGISTLRKLVISGYSAPHLPRRRPPLHGLDDASLASELARLGGTPESVLRNREIMALFSHILRSDFRACETYVHGHTQPLDVPLLAFSGTQDEDHPPASIAAWRSQTSEDFLHIPIQGGHFFINTHQSLVLDALRTALRTGATHPTTEAAPH